MPNEEQARNWTDNADGWVQHERVFDGVFTPVTAALLAASDLGPRQRVLDVGCGSGTVLLAAVEAGADVVGVDISPGMVEAAAVRVPAADVHVADAQTADLPTLAPGRPFDRVVSRFGVMFFDDPVAAFANLASATAPGGTLTFACWGPAEANPMFTHGYDPIVRLLDEQPQPPVTGAPGPTAFADTDRVARILREAGWSDVDAPAHDVTLDYGFDGTDGVENRVATILGTTSGRAAREELEPRLGSAGWGAVLDVVRDELRADLVDGAVRIPGLVTIVSARR